MQREERGAIRDVVTLFVHNFRAAPFLSIRIDL